MRNLLKEILRAYDEFMLSDMDTHLSNPAWERICEVMHMIRIYLNRRK